MLATAQAGPTTPITGTLSTTPASTLILDFYALHPAGMRYLAAAPVTTDESGDASFDLVLNVATQPNEQLVATATDPDGNTSEFSAPFALALPPTAVIVGGPYQVNEGSSIVLQGNATDPNDPPAAITLYEWDFDYDGTNFQTQATAAAPWFDAAELDGPATYQVALRVTSANSLSAIATTTVTVNNVAPTITGFTTHPARVVRNEPVTFTFATVDPSSADQAASFTYSILWDRNDPKAEWQTFAPFTPITHTFSYNGNADSRRFNFQVSATDKDGATGGPFEFSIDVYKVKIEDGTVTVGGTNEGDEIVMEPGSIRVLFYREGEIVDEVYFSDAQIQEFGGVTSLRVFGGNFLAAGGDAAHGAGPGERSGAIGRRDLSLRGDLERLGAGENTHGSVP